ncbi:apoptosis regulator BAX [Trichonephila clavipes]|uniref:Apoptosis regulator BAX n=1 Tax=Trichonephila clavipes TaxID=2585209 RepID=A0A8X6RY23_TRICX|nr:apoptosis regulator BAX [Trichonephila clavipes]
MAPNLLSRTAFVRADFDSTNSQCVDEKSVSSDFILQNVYSHLIKDGANFRALCPANHLEEELIRHIIDVVDDFKQNFIGTIKGLLSTLEFSEDTSGTIIQGVANELFCEGITWSRIIAFFVFVGELTLQYLANNYPPSIVDVIYECYSKFVKETLTNWISDHGGWEGVRSLSIKRDDSNQEITTPMPNGSLDKGWANSILYSTVKMFGTIAFLANSSGSNLP